MKISSSYPAYAQQSAKSKKLSSLANQNSRTQITELPRMGAAQLGLTSSQPSFKKVYSSVEKFLKEVTLKGPYEVSVEFLDKVRIKEAVGDVPLIHTLSMGAGKNEVKQKIYMDTLKTVLERGAGVNQKLDLDNLQLYYLLNEKPPLHAASIAGNVEAMRLLVESGADVNEPSNSKSYKPIHNAALSDSIEAVKFLLERGANINEKAGYQTNGGDGELATPLAMAINEGKLEAVNFLLKNGADTNIPHTERAMYTDTETSILHLAATQKNSQIMEAILDAGAEMTFDTYGYLPIHAAASRGSREVVNLLLERGVDVNTPTKDGRTPLVMAGYKNSLEVVNALLEQGADKTIISKNGDSMLHAYAGMNDLEGVKGLLEWHSDKFNINATDERGWTPLMHALEGKSFDEARVAKFLIEQQDINLHAKDGRISALSLAVINKDKQMISLLTDTMKKQVNDAIVSSTWFAGGSEDKPIKDFILSQKIELSKPKKADS